MHERQRTDELQAMIEMAVNQACHQLLGQLHEDPDQSHTTLFHHPEKLLRMRMLQKTKRREIVVRIGVELLEEATLLAHKVDGRRTHFHENEVAYREFTFPIGGYHTRITSMSAARHESPKYLSRALVLQSHAVIRKVISCYPDLRFTPKVTGVIIDGAQARSGEGILTGWSSEMARKLGYSEDSELGGRFTYVYR